MNFKNFFHNIYLEKFDTTVDFLLNPENNDKTLPELERDFTDAGGEILGSGAFGTTYTHPSWNYVLKTMTLDSCYVPFARYVYNHPEPCFPKILAPPKRIVPNFTRTWAEDRMYILKMEKLHGGLNSADRNIIDDMRYLYGVGIKSVSLEEAITAMNNTKTRLWGDTPLLEDARPLALSLVKMHFAISASVENKTKGSSSFSDRCREDMHYGNFMKRPSTNEIVITDPYAHGDEDPSGGKDYIRKYGRRSTDIIRDRGLTGQAVRDPLTKTQMYSSREGRFKEYPVKDFIIPGGKRTQAKQKKKLKNIYDY